MYSAERQAGFSTQTDLLAVWVAAVTYSGVALGIVASGQIDASVDRAQGVTGLAAVIAFVVIPLPAFAIAAYHLILFGIGMIHSRSIAVLELELASKASDAIRSSYAKSLIGSRAEAVWTETSSWLLRPVQGLAYLPPYVGALALLGLCLFQIFRSAVFGLPVGIVTAVGYVAVICFTAVFAWKRIGPLFSPAP
jgi:hypothetical protein